MGERQKCCARPECRKKRKREQEKLWIEKNPGYFQGRSGNTRAWRKAHPGSQKAWRAKKRSEIQTQIPPQSTVQSLRIHLRGVLPNTEIQTQIVRLTRCGREFWLDGLDLHPE